MAPPVKRVRPGQLIVIDAGHGGKDLGTQTLTGPKAYEKYLSLSTAYILERYLKEMGFKTVMTRTDDTFVPLKDRAAFANERRPVLFVSVHYNAAENTSAHGIEVFYHKSEKDPDRVEKSKAVAGKVLEGVIATTEAKSRGVKTANFVVIKETKMPAILVEGGFLTNSDEATKIRNGSYLKQVAWGIATGIREYFAEQR